MGLSSILRDLSFNNAGRRMKIRIKADQVTHAHVAGRFSGSTASVSTSAPRGTLTRSTLQRGWQKKGSVFVTIVTPDGVELAAQAESETQARRYVAQYNTRSRGHRQE